MTFLWTTAASISLLADGFFFKASSIHRTGSSHSVLDRPVDFPAAIFFHTLHSFFQRPTVCPDKLNWVAMSFPLHATLEAEDGGAAGAHRTVDNVFLPGDPHLVVNSSFLYSFLFFLSEPPDVETPDMDIRI